jgi:hypothetical protein
MASHAKSRVCIRVPSLWTGVDTSYHEINRWHSELVGSALETFKLTRASTALAADMTGWTGRHRATDAVIGADRTGAMGSSG